MKAHIDRSRFLRIPVSLLEVSGLEGEVVITARRGELTIRKGTNVREGWAEAFRDMSRSGDDEWFDNINLTRWDEWDW